MKRRVILAAGAVLVAAASAYSATLWWRQPARPSMDPGDAVLVAQGQSIYGQSCAVCHGQNLEGQPDWKIRLPNGLLPAPPHDVTGHTWHHTDRALFEITKNGLVPPYAPERYESAMPAFRETLTDQEVAAVLAYIKSTWPPKAIQRQELVTIQDER